MTKQKCKPTEKAYHELQAAYDFFNAQLFAGRLPDLLITLQRGKRTFGYFSPERFDGTSRVSELAMNPEYFSSRSLADTLSTLVHEMVHVWQHYLAEKKPRSGYHDKVWGEKMELIGLMPSNTGRPGGKRTGQQMTHYIMAGGRFQRAVFDLLKSGYSISWYDVAGVQHSIPPGFDKSILNDWIEDAKEDQELIEKLTKTVGQGELDEPGTVELVIQPPTKGNSNRDKYTCPDCGLNAWAKPGANLYCGDCDIQLDVSQ